MTQTKIQEKFYPLTKEITTILRQAKLTAAESRIWNYLIEIDDWKAALGQILVYSGFYPKHRKRLHLFGKPNELIKVANLEATCLTFDVNVTAEEV